MAGPSRPARFGELEVIFFLFLPSSAATSGHCTIPCNGGLSARLDGLGGAVNHSSHCTWMCNGGSFCDPLVLVSWKQSHFFSSLPPPAIAPSCAMVDYPLASANWGRGDRFRPLHLDVQWWGPLGPARFQWRVGNHSIVLL